MFKHILPNKIFRNAIAAAKLSGITEELGLTSVQFQVFKITKPQKSYFYY
jgi:hypothetical protein